MSGLLEDDDDDDDDTDVDEVDEVLCEVELLVHRQV